MAQRDGNRKTREQLPKRKPKLGYYYIVTDSKKTETNYLTGLRDSIPKEQQPNIKIKVKKNVTAQNLVSTALEEAALNPQFSELWIVFDRDLTPFDKIIKDAADNNINVGWSNPCIEIWFHAYFGEMPTPSLDDSQKCCENFEDIFYKKTQLEYNKADSKIFEKLRKFGNEKKAIEIAQKKLKEYEKDCKKKPSMMCPATTLHKLVSEIINKTELHN